MTPGLRENDAKPKKERLAPLREFAKAIVDLLYPNRCIVCREWLRPKESYRERLCLRCWGNIERTLPPFCSRCGKHLDRKQLAKNVCSSCIRAPLAFDRAFAPFAYDETMKLIIHQFKYGGKEYLSSLLGEGMAEFAVQYNVPAPYVDMIIPVPLHRTRLRQRSYNQAEELGKHLARRFNKPLERSSLLRHRYTPSQTSFEPSLRFLNVRNSFRVPSPETVRGKNILLVDDVLTTGATCSEAAATLKNAGAHAVFVMTAAH